MRPRIVWHLASPTSQYDVLLIYCLLLLFFLSLNSFVILTGLWDWIPCKNKIEEKTKKKEEKRGDGQEDPLLGLASNNPCPVYESNAGAVQVRKFKSLCAGTRSVHRFPIAAEKDDGHPSRCTPQGTKAQDTWGHALGRRILVVSYRFTILGGRLG